MFVPFMTEHARARLADRGQRIGLTNMEELVKLAQECARRCRVSTAVVLTETPAYRFVAVIDVGRTYACPIVVTVEQIPIKVSLSTRLTVSAYYTAERLMEKPPVWGWDMKPIYNV